MELFNVLVNNILILQDLGDKSITLRVGCDIVKIEIIEHNSYRITINDKTEYIMSRSK